MNKIMVIAEWQRAWRALRAAEVLAREGLYKDAVSRAYYATLHAAKAALFIHDVATESHATVRRMFGLHLIRSSEIESMWSSNLGESLDDRLAAGYDASTSLRWSMPSIPFDNLLPARGPHPLMAHHVAKGIIEKANTKGLADDPGMQMQYQKPTVLLTVAIQNVKTLLEEFAIAVHRHVPLPECVYVIQFEHHEQDVQFSLRRFHGIWLLVIDPVTHVANTRLRQHLWCTGRLTVLRPQPAHGGSARGAL